jgi:outer membrane receptor for ferrienterochelin and colicin
MMMHAIARTLFFSALSAHSALHAQDPGRITGRVIDADQGTPISGAVVELLGVTPSKAATSGLDGRYNLLGVPAGTVTIKVRLIGYAAKSVTGIALAAGAIVTQDVSLEPESIQLQELSVTAAAEKGSVASALSEQRQAVNVVNAVTAEEIRRSPDGDAAAAVQRVSGVTVQDGKFVFVRGLGERYTTTSLNGARIPSTEPERKVVPLDLFPAGLLEGISTSKTFTPDLSGDFSGAEVNIKTREFPADRQVTFSIGTAFNTRVTGKDIWRPRNAGLEWLALGSRDRRLPGPVRTAGDFDPAPAQPQVNTMVNSLRNAWSPIAGKGQIGSSMGMSVGGSDPMFGHPVGYLVSLSYSYEPDVRDEQVRANAQPGNQPGQVNEIDRYTGQTGRGSVLWGGLLNLSTNLGASSKVAMSTSYNRSADNDSRMETGVSENLGQPLQVGRLRYVERSALSTQLTGEHQLALKHQIDWSAAYSRVTRDEPDRSEIVYTLETGQSPAWLSVSNEGAVRTYADLNEHNVQGALNYKLTFGGKARPHAFRFGGLYRATDRTADNNAYSISGNMNLASQQLAPEEIFDGRFANPADEVFRMTPLSQGGSYTAEDRLAAGYTLLQLYLGRKVEVVAGARLENSRVTVRTQPTIGSPVEATPEYTDVLPSAAVNFLLSEKHQLRFAASQTLSRPEYRELAPVQYREVIGAENVVGNPDLKRALIQNLDARWEFYPSPAEVMSVGLFYKHFTDPIEQVYLGTSGTRIISYLNAESARNIGVELELRKNLGSVSPKLQPWSFFANATLMDSKVTIDAQGLAINSERAMVGQAPYVVNGGLSYLSTSGRWSGTLLYNVVGRRIVSAAENPLPNVYEEERHSLDFSLRFPVTGGLTGKVDARNLLDNETRLTQGTVTKEFYYTGRRFGIGLTWIP